MNRTTARLTGLAAALVVGTLVLAGCGENTDAGHGSMSAHNASTSPATGAETAFSDVDVTFAAGLIPHHQSAIEMAQVASEKSDNPEIKELAENIVSAQRREIEQMMQWREAWYPEG